MAKSTSALGQGVVPQSTSQEVKDKEIQYSSNT